MGPTLARLSLLLAILGAPSAHAADASAPGSAPLEVIVLGSGGPGATGRAGSCYLALIDGTPRILVDAGPGSFVRLGETGQSLDATDVVLLTHLHADHAGELPGLFKARAVSAGAPITFHVFGPDGRAASGDGAGFPATSRFVELLFGPHGAFAYLRDFSAPMTIVTTDLATRTATAEPKTIYGAAGAAGRFTIRAIAGHHRDAPAVIYRIDYAGKSVTFSGDIDPAGLPALRRIARDTSLLVFNSVVLDPPGSPPILYTLHSPPRAIGEVAADSGAGRLLLSHLSPATDGQRDAVAASIAQSYHGPVQFAEDRMRIVP